MVATGSPAAHHGQHAGPDGQVGRQVEGIRRGREAVVVVPRLHQPDQVTGQPAAEPQQQQQPAARVRRTVDEQPAEAVDHRGDGRRGEPQPLSPVVEAQVPAEQHGQQPEPPPAPRPPARQLPAPQPPALQRSSTWMRSHPSHHCRPRVGDRTRSSSIQVRTVAVIASFVAVVVRGGRTADRGLHRVPLCGSRGGSGWGWPASPEWRPPVRWRRATSGGVAPTPRRRSGPACTSGSRPPSRPTRPAGPTGPRAGAVRAGVAAPPRRPPGPGRSPATAGSRS